MTNKLQCGIEVELAHCYCNNIQKRKKGLFIVKYKFWSHLIVIQKDTKKRALNVVLMFADRWQFLSGRNANMSMLFRNE